MALKKGEDGVKYGVVQASAMIRYLFQESVPEINISSRTQREKDCGSFSVAAEPDFASEAAVSGAVDFPHGSARKQGAANPEHLILLYCGHATAWLERCRQADRQTR